MVHGLKKQQGMSGSGIMTVMVLIGFFAYLVMQISPAYMENNSVKDIVNNIKEDPLTVKMSTREIRTSIMRRLIINSIRDIKKEHIEIKKSGGKLTVNIEYEVRRPMFKNLSVVMAFKESMELKTN
ncbi:hypothetical protein MNBD_GAMMA26-1465 [hydrothermal vent metagenome]|uniref:DUF4845 domain-containing protein n=1 Tax=hydrothermal vent metagenome TaxID=652676 RepID=A0A3B1BZ65_9ZZZZ